MNEYFGKHSLGSGNEQTELLAYGWSEVRICGSLGARGPARRRVILESTTRIALPHPRTTTKDDAMRNAVSSSHHLFVIHWVQASGWVTKCCQEFAFPDPTRPTASLPPPVTEVTHSCRKDYSPKRQTRPLSFSDNFGKHWGI